MKQRVRLTESNFRRIIKNCINEAVNSTDGRYANNVFKCLCKIEGLLGDNFDRMERAARMLDNAVGRERDDDFQYIINESYEIARRMHDLLKTVQRKCDDFQTDNGL